MGYYDAAWYLDYGNGTSTGYYSVAQWAATHVYAAGAAVRQLAAPTVGNERVFVCIIAGTSLGAEPTWVVTRGAKTVEAAGPTWMEMTGVAGLNGDTTNTPTWTQASTGNSSPSLGAMIQRNNGASYWVCTTAGTVGGAEPAWPNDTAGTTQADNTVTWTCLGVVGNWAGWQTPCPRLAIFSSGAGWAIAAGGPIINNIAGKCDIYVASEHAETQASAMTFTNGFGRAQFGTPTKILCVTKTTVPPVSANLTTGASISTTGAFSLTVPVGLYWMQGITLSVGSGAVNNNIVFPNSTNAYFRNCAFVKAGTTAQTASFNIGVSDVMVWDNCTVQFGNTGDQISLSGSGASRLIWRNTTAAIQGATIPTLLFNASWQGEVIIEGVDLSAITGTLFNYNASASRAVLRNCKIGAVTMEGGFNAGIGTMLDVIRCDSGATNYRHERWLPAGSHVIETTIVRTGGATDGTTPISWKIVTTGTIINWNTPAVMECMPMAIWNDTTAATRTVTVFGIWGGGAVPNNDEIWIEVEYPGSSSTPIGTIATTTKSDPLATGSAVASDTSTWGGSTTAFKLVATLSSPQPAMKGPFLVTVKAARASSTYYIDPAPVLS
jgi:hypothetical protein